MCLFRCLFSLLLHLRLRKAPHSHQLLLPQLLFHVLTYRIKPLVSHRLFGGQPVLEISPAPIAHIMVVDQRFIKVVKQIVIYKFLCGGVDELLPAASREVRQQALGLPVQPQAVLLDVLVQLRASQHLRDLAQLVVVVLAAEERRLVEHDAQEHARERPDVEGVVVVLPITPQRENHVVVRQKLRPLVVPRAHAHVVLLVYSMGETAHRYGACSSPRVPSR